MLRPAVSSWEKSGLSKFTLTHPTRGGRHLTDMAVMGILAWIGWICWNSWTESLAMEFIFIKGKVSSPNLILFLLIQIIEIIIANKSRLDLSREASWITSKKLEQLPVVFIR